MFSGKIDVLDSTVGLFLFLDDLADVFFIVYLSIYLLWSVSACMRVYALVWQWVV